MVSHKHKYGKNVVTIHPGEFYVSGEDEYISTLLGSCIAVCLYDIEKQVSGMNHFMLAGNVTAGGFSSEVTTRHGMESILVLLDDMYRLGCSKSNITAKIFGGGKVLSTENPVHDVPADNMRVARVVLEMEDIPIELMDIGGKFTRKLIMDVKTGKVFLKRSVNSQAEDE